MSNQAYNGIYGVRAGGAAIAAHETSQAAMLDQMRDRLAALTEEARSIRAQMPNEFGPDVERIQQQMQRLGERLSDLGHSALVPYNLGDPEKRTASARFKAIRYVTEEDVRVARVAPDEVIALGDRFGIPHRVPAQTMPQHRAVPADQARYMRDGGQPWDDAAANAMLRLYESGEAFAAGAHQEMASASHGRAQAMSGGRPPQTMPPLHGAMAMQTSATGAAQPAPRGCAIETGVLDQRFAEIAARIEESLARMRPDNALASLSRRFDDLEAQITGVAGQMATRADIEEIHALQGQIEEISGHLDQFRRQLARLDIIDAHLGTLTSQLSDERLTRLINEGVQVTDIGRLDAIDAQLRIIAVQLSDERLCGLVSRNANRELDYDDLADATARRVMTNFTEMNSGGDAGSAREIGEMRGMIEGLIAERRNSDENNASMLDTVQQAIIRVLDRIDELEETHRLAAQQAAEAAATVSSSVAAITAPMQQSAAYSAPDYASDTAMAAAPRRSGLGRSLREVVAAAEPDQDDYDPLAQAAPPAPQPIATPVQVEDFDDLIPATARVFAQMPSASRQAAAAPVAMEEPVVVASQSAADDFQPVANEQDESDFLPIEDVVEANVRAYREDAAAEKAPRVPVYTSSGFDLDAAFSRSRDVEAESFGEAQRSMEVLRHDFIADAHRAKLKAASRPEGADADLRAGKLSVSGDEGPSKPRARRSIFSFRSQRAAMGLLILLAAIPAAIFFMPRTTPSTDVVHPTATIAPAPMDAEDAITTTTTAPAEIEPAPQGVTPAPAQREKQFVPPIEQGANEYDGAPVLKDGPFETAAIPNGITMQEGGASPEQLAQMNEQARMAYLSGQLGIAAAQTTPAALMEQNILQHNGGAAPSSVTEEEEIVAAPGASKLPPATVGPFSMRLAAAQGDASAQFEVASRLAEGKGTDQDLREAAQWYQRSAANGFALAQFRLATLYERGIGVKADRQRAQVWYERAASQGNVKAMHNLAVLSASRSPNGDYETAARWFKAASEHGLADSQYNLAVLYENGMGVKQDLEASYLWLILAAKAGDTDAAGRRDAIKAKLGAKAAGAVEQSAAAWQAKPMKNMVNDARLAGQAWQGGAKRG